jgi:hypothetical protein
MFTGRAKAQKVWGGATDGSAGSTLPVMSIQRLQRDGFVVERHGDGTSTYFVYAGHMRHVELLPKAGILHIPLPRLDDAEHIEGLVEALWELSIPGVVDNIEVSYREGDPNEVMTVRSR